MDNEKKYYTWEEYAPNRFRRWDVEESVWVIMEIHTCCLMHEKRHYAKGKNFKIAKAWLKSTKELKRAGTNVEGGV